jgi:hypothetical protein
VCRVRQHLVGREAVGALSTWKEPEDDVPRPYKAKSGVTIAPVVKLGGPLGQRLHIAYRGGILGETSCGRSFDATQLDIRHVPIESVTCDACIARTVRDALLKEDG